MMKRKTKITFFNFLPYECAAAEEYLEAMAESGWMLQSVTGAFFRFREIEPKKIKYSVDVFNKLSDLDPKDTDIAVEYRQYCEAAGWKYICQKGKIQIFCTEDYENAIDIHTDAEEKFKSVLRASLHSIAGELSLILLFMINLYIQLFMVSAEYTLATNLGVLSVIVTVSLIIISCINIINFILWVIKVKRHLKENTIMPYNNKQQLIIKNIFKGGYALLILLILLKQMISDNHDDKVSSVSVVLLVTIIIVIVVFSRILINKKSYSRKTNLIITIVSGIFLVYILMAFAGAAVINGAGEKGQTKSLKEKTSLTLVDFGYEKDDKNPYIQHIKSILAKRENCFLDSEGNSLNYTVFQSPYHWIIDFDKDRLISSLNRYGDDLKPISTKLPNNIKVYSNSKKKIFVLLSKDKIVNINSNLSNIDEGKFLDIVYNKLFVK